MKNWKSISATLLATALVTSTAGQAWANETERVDASKFETVNLQDALENVKDETATGKDLEVISSIVPAGYLANNIFALSSNLEKISNPKAKEALRKNIERAIARWEAKYKAEVELANETEDDVTATPDEDVTTVTVLPENEKPDDQMNKEEKKALKKAEKEEKKALKKAEKLARDEAKKAAELAKKEAKRVKNEEHNANKDSKKEERHDRHKGKNESKGNKDKD